VSTRNFAESLERIRAIALFVAAAGSLAACAPASDEGSGAQAEKPAAAAPEEAAMPQEPAFTPRPIEVGVPFVTDDGLQIIAHKLGEGSLATNGRPVTVHYTGWLLDETAANKKGNKFDSSVDRSTPFRFVLGQGRVIRGWEEGVLGMKVGGSRTLIIPPDMAYGPRGRPPVIPPSSTLVFDVELLGVE
jgi:FKBP-type peptidyl-prolyl cis-trans isomerase